MVRPVSETPVDHPRSPITAFDGERLPGIGHNQGPPLDTARSWRTFAWKKARKALLPRLPLEVIKRRVARAAELGLDYPAYASILMGTGRDIVGFMFTCEALGLRLAKGLPVEPIPETIAQKVRTLTGCQKILTARAPANVTVLRQHLARTGAMVFEGSGLFPDENATWSGARGAIRAALDPLKLPSDAVIMIGTEPRERTWADAAKLAKFLPAERYFTD